MHRPDADSVEGGAAGSQTIRRLRASLIRCV